MSPGSRSGVNWMRLEVPSTLWAIARASEVLPVPGKSSSSRWPSLSRAVNDNRMTKVLPRSTWSTLATSRLKMSVNQLACSGVMLMVLPFGRSSMGVLRSRCLSLSRCTQSLVEAGVLVLRSGADLYPGLHPDRSLVGAWVGGRRHAGCRERAEGSVRVHAQHATTVRVQQGACGVSPVGRQGGGRQEADVTADQGRPGGDRRQGHAR